MARDSFDPYSPPTAETVDALSLRFRVWDGESGNEYDARYEFYIKDEDGNHVELREGDLIPYLTTAQKSALQNFIDSMFDKAKATAG